MNVRQHARGYTLVELAVTVAVATVVGATFLSVVFMQTKLYLQRLEEVDAHQNGRAALNVLRRYVRSARFGLAQDANAGGTVLIGKCYTPGAPGVAAAACNNVDAGADRLRAISLRSDNEFLGTSSYASANNCSTNVVDSVTQVHDNQTVVNPLSVGTLAAIGGPCTSPVLGVSAASDVVVLGNDSPGAACAHRFSFTALETNTPALSCVNGYAPGFGFGRVDMADFFIGRDPTGSPALMLTLDPRVTTPMVVAFDVEDFQVRYGLDLSLPVDRSVDRWCDDPRIPADGGSCSTQSIPAGTTYTSANNYNRIVALQMAVRVRTNSPRQGVAPSTLDPNWTAANPVVNPSDGYRRWIYATTVQLRNNNL